MLIVYFNLNYLQLKLQLRIKYVGCEQRFVKLIELTILILIVIFSNIQLEAVKYSNIPILDIFCCFCGLKPDSFHFYFVVTVK